MTGTSAWPSRKGALSIVPVPMMCASLISMFRFNLASLLIGSWPWGADCWFVPIFSTVWTLERASNRLKVVVDKESDGKSRRKSVR